MHQLFDPRDIVLIYKMNFKRGRGRKREREKEILSDLHAVKPEERLGQREKRASCPASRAIPSHACVFTAHLFNVTEHQVPLYLIYLLK